MPLNYGSVVLSNTGHPQVRLRGEKLMGQASTTESYLKIKNVWKAFGDFFALKDISLEVKRGEFVCFLGPSGCGKTTLLRAIAGLDIQTTGAVFQDGKDISALPPAERDFGIVFQSYALFPNLTVEKNIAFGLENSGIARPDIDKRVAELLELVGLPEQARKYPAQLSGGQQQRIALARALATVAGAVIAGRTTVGAGCQGTGALCATRSRTCSASSA